ncbi:MAG: antibiotic transport system permease protein [Puniceicoccaceae bacterium 5H]|nr:MAG: antibiotic transport system permease protein [Puniceicoccaceae bacterium 5H]
MGRLLTLIRKEFLALLRDPRSRMVLIMPPLLQLFIFSFAATLEVKDNAITVFNQDQGPHSMEVVSRLTRTAAFSEIHYAHSGAEVTADINQQRSLIALRFAPDFSASIERGETGEIQAIIDGRRSNSGQIAMGYVNEILQGYTAEIAPTAAAQKPEVEVITRNWFNPNLHYIFFTIPGLLMILTTMITMIVTALSVARERELGTFDQLLVSPYSATEILIGKAIPAYVVALAEGSFIVLVTTTFYGVPFEGSLLQLFLELSFYLLSLIGVGLFISSLCETQQQAILGVFCFLLPSVLLSGFASPVDNMPRWLQIIALANPLRHFFPISKGAFLKDLPLELAWPHLWPLALIATVTLLAASWLFRNKSA